MKRLALPLLVLIAVACARTARPSFAPMPEARRGQVELDPQEATKKLGEAMTAAGLPVTEVATRDGYVETAWFDTTDLKPVHGRPLGSDDVRVRAWVMPYRYGWSEITMEAVYRPLADPSLPPRELERSVAFDHPIRVKIREIMQQMGLTSTLAEADAPKPILKRPIMDSANVKRPSGKLGTPADTAAPAKAALDSVAPVAVDTPPKPMRDSAMVFRPRTPGDTIHQGVKPGVAPVQVPHDTTVEYVPAPPDTTRAAPAAAAQVTSGYAVQVAATPDSALASQIEARLKGLGFSARIVREEGLLKVRTQMYASRTDAVIALEKLRGSWSDAFLVRE